MYTLNCKGKLLSLHKPVVMGIINATPDSFFEGHLQKGIEGVAAMAKKMLLDGAGMLDIGGQSTKPGSQRVDADEELRRVLPVIEIIMQENPGAIISIDTYHSKVASEAVNTGASVVNDISGGTMDAGMIDIVASLNVPFICMHMQGRPETMQHHPEYDDVVKTVLDFFIQQTARCRAAGIKDIILDPGFGFGKTIQHNFQLLKNLKAFKMRDAPILAGLSRKGTIYKTLGITAAEALNGTTALNTIALMNGASILRVHDVIEAVEAVKLFDAYSQA